MMPEILGKGAGKPGPVPQDFNAIAWLETLDLSALGEDWPEADLFSVVRYVRRSKLLDLPPACSVPQATLISGHCSKKVYLQAL